MPRLLPQIRHPERLRHLDRMRPRCRGVVQIRVILETRNPLTSAALAIFGVTRKQHFLNHAKTRNRLLVSQHPRANLGVTSQRCRWRPESASIRRRMPAGSLVPALAPAGGGVSIGLPML